MWWLWLIVAATSILLLVGVAALIAQLYIMHVYFPHLPRILQEKPLFITPFARPVDDAEAAQFASTNGVVLCGCYLRATGPRKGVIVFGLEYGSNRWACVSYCKGLREQGFDIFCFDFRGQGESPAQPGYEPMQWVTNYEVEDFQAALAYVKSRPDADPRGVGVFGVSRGAGAGLLAAAGEPYVRCAVTDGLFATHTTMIPHMRRFALIYGKHSPLIRNLPRWYFRWIAHVGLRYVAKERHCGFPHLEDAMPRFAPRPLLMIHGGADNYIKPETGRALFDRAGEPKEFWLVERAKHNQSLQTAGEDYQRRLLAFFTTHLGADSAPCLRAG